MTMTTNKNIDSKSDLAKKGLALLEAAHEYWKQYQKDVGCPGAVVWLENDNGHFVLFTRSEYKQAIMAAAGRECFGQERLFSPFEK